MNQQAKQRIDQLGLGKKAALALALLYLFPLQLLANVWLDSSGTTWFYETRNSPGEIVAGTWSEPALAEGKSYRMSFNVTKLEGQMALYVGLLPRIVIDHTGSYSVDFKIAWGGKQRMAFWTLSNNVVASVANIDVAETTTASGPPRGHYLSFARERNLKVEVLDVLANPSSASYQQRSIADGLDAALSAPGVNGFQVAIDWRTIETGDGVFNWRLLDDNMLAAKRYGMTVVVKVLDRSFDGSNIMPRYFPSAYVVWTTGGGNAGYVAKRWDPYVYTRIIRLYKAIATRYRNDAAFGGIATTESAVGNFKDGGYTVAKYKTALIQIVTQTQSALVNGKLFWYLNFIRGSSSNDMNKDPRVDLVNQVPHRLLAVGGPDITPDVRGMPGSVSSYRIHVRKLMPTAAQFCHAQHVDLGLGGRNTKSNQHRQTFLKQIATVRENESKPGFNGTPATFELDDLRTPAGAKVNLHPNWVLGNLWTPRELFEFANRNFECDYMFWNYVDSGTANVYGWPDIKPVIADTRALYQ